MATNSEELRTDFTGDADGLVKESKRAADAFSDVEDEAKQLGRTADLTDADIDAMGDALANSIRDSEKARDALKKMREELEKVGDAAPDSMRKVSDAAEDAGNATRESLKDAGSEAGQEFKANLAETLQSGGDPSEMILGTLSGVIPGLSGVMAGAAAALAGIAGLVFQAIKREKENVEQLLTSFSDALTDLYEQGVMVANKIGLQNAMADWIEANIDGFKDMQDELDHVDIDMATFIGTIAAGGKPLDDMIGQLEDARDEVVRTQGAHSAQALALNDVIGRATAFKDEAEKVRLKHEGIADAVGVLNAKLGVTDTNMDGIIDDSDEIKTNLEDAGKVNLDTGLPKTLTDSASIKSKLDETAKKGVEVPVSFYTKGGGSPAAVGGGSGSGGYPGPRAAAAPTAGQGQGAAYITNNWSVTVNARTGTPTEIVKAIERYARDNGRPSSVSVTV